MKNLYTKFNGFLNKLSLKFSKIKYFLIVLSLLYQLPYKSSGFTGFLSDWFGDWIVILTLVAFKIKLEGLSRKSVITNIVIAYTLLYLYSIMNELV